MRQFARRSADFSGPELDPIGSTIRIHERGCAAVYAPTKLSAMRVAPLAPKLHLFVCANRRAADDPLGAGCGDAGDAVFDALKAEVARRGIYRAAWVTRTQCLGLCPKRGCSVAVYPKGAIVIEAEASDAPALFQAALDEASRGAT